VLPLFTQVELLSNSDMLSGDLIEYNKEIIENTDKLEFISTTDSDKIFQVGLFVLSGNDIQKDLIYIKPYQ
jgi:hypothetical protein